MWWVVLIALFVSVGALSLIVFCLFNFRQKNKAKCFAGDVGSVGIAFILLFAVGRLIARTGDVTYLTFLLVYGVDGCLIIIHRIMLHEHLGEAHHKHMYQLMSNELSRTHRHPRMQGRPVRAPGEGGYDCPEIRRTNHR